MLALSAQTPEKPVPPPPLIVKETWLGPKEIKQPQSVSSASSAVNKATQSAAYETLNRLYKAYRMLNAKSAEIAHLKQGNLNELTLEIGKWAEATFPDSTPETIIIHLTREVIELCKRPASGEEMADVLLLLLHLAFKQGVDLTAEVRSKFVINQGRTWGKPDPDGVIEHIR